MKLHTSLLSAFAAGMALSTSAQAALLAHEPFNYTAGLNLATQTGGTGFTSAWTANASDYTAVGGLSYSGLVSTGGAVEVVGNGSWSTSARRNITSIDTTTGVIWGSYLIRPDVIGDDGIEIKFGEGAPPGTPNNINWGFASGMGNGGGTAPRLDANSNSGAVFGSNLTVGQTHLLVWAYNSASTGDGFFPGDFVAWIDLDLSLYDVGDPTSFPDPGTASIYKFVGGGQPNIGITQIFGRNTTFTFDEMRVGSNFASVIPEPSSALLGALGVFAAVGIRRRKSVN